MAGTVAASGSDWQQVRPDGVIEIDAHYALITNQGETIEVRSAGLRKVSPEVAVRLSRQDDVSPDEYYFRTHVRLYSTSARLAWVNDLIAVSTGQRDRDVVRIHVHEVE